MKVIFDRESNGVFESYNTNSVSFCIHPKPCFVPVAGSKLEIPTLGMTASQWSNVRGHWRAERTSPEKKKKNIKNLSSRINLPWKYPRKIPRSHSLESYQMPPSQLNLKIRHRSEGGWFRVSPCPLARVVTRDRRKCCSLTPALERKSV